MKCEMRLKSCSCEMKYNSLENVLRSLPGHKTPFFLIAQFAQIIRKLSATKIGSQRAQKR